MKEELVSFIQSLYATEGQIPLHAPFVFPEDSKRIEQEFLTGLSSTASKTVLEFENRLSEVLKTPYVLATNSGTAALHTAMLLSGVAADDLVITTPFSFVATANVIRYCGATPQFIDIEKESLAISPKALHAFLEKECEVIQDVCYHTASGKKVRVCLLVHTFGHPAQLAEIQAILTTYNIDLVEDAAQAFSSEYHDKQCGTFGRFGCFSFNGNKLISTSGGGALVCQTEADYLKAEQLMNQGKEKKGFNYYHSVVGYNYKMNGLSAAIGLTQLTHLEQIKTEKSKITSAYRDFFSAHKISFLKEPVHCHANFWLNNILLNSKAERDELLAYLNKNQIEARPAWWPIDDLPMYKKRNKEVLPNSYNLFERIVSLPSGSLYHF